MLTDQRPRPAAPPWPGPTPDVESTDREWRIALRSGGLQPRQDLASLARQLGCPAGEWLAAHGGVFDRRDSPLKTRRLHADWAALLAASEGLGRHRVQVDNVIASLAIEVEAGNASPLRQGAVQLGAWAEGHAVEECFANGNVRRSLRFVDHEGRGVLALTLLDRTRLADFHGLAERFGALALRAPHQGRGESCDWRHLVQGLLAEAAP